MQVLLLVLPLQLPVGLEVRSSIDAILLMLRSLPPEPSLEVMEKHLANGSHGRSQVVDGPNLSGGVCPQIDLCWNKAPVPERGNSTAHGTSDPSL